MKSTRGLASSRRWYRKRGIRTDGKGADREIGGGHEDAEEEEEEEGGEKRGIRYWHTALWLYEQVNDSVRSLWVPRTTSSMLLKRTRSPSTGCGPFSMEITSSPPCAPLYRSYPLFRRENPLHLLDSTECFIAA